MGLVIGAIYLPNQEIVPITRSIRESGSISFAITPTVVPFMSGDKTSGQQLVIADNERLKLALDSAGLGLWEFDPETSLFTLDNRCKVYLGLSGNELALFTYDSLLTCVQVNNQPQLLDSVRNAIATRNNEQFESCFHTVSSDGNASRFLRCVASFVVDPSGTLIKVSGVLQDLSTIAPPLTREHVPTTISPHQAINDGTIFRALIEQAPVATCLFVGHDMRIEVANDIMLGYWGKDRQILGLPLLLAVPELDGQPFLAILENVYTTGKTYQSLGARAELLVEGVLGTFYFDFTYKPLRNAAGEVYAIMDMAVDVTEQVLARQKLEEAEESLRSAIDLAELGTWSIDPATEVISYSDRIRTWFGYNNSTGTETDIAFNPIHPNDRERVRQTVAYAFSPESGGIYQSEYTVVAKDTGRERILHAQGRTFFDEQGKPVKMVGTAQDVTAQRKTQLMLEQQVTRRTAELQEAINELQRSNLNLERFAYVASHDLQEPLRKIQSFGDLLKNQYEGQLGNGADYLERMQNAAGRMATLISDLLVYSRISNRKETGDSVPLNEVVATVLTDLEIRIEEGGAQIEVGELPTIRGDRSQLGQLFQNLISNALKFRQKGQPPIIPLIQIRAELMPAVDLPASVIPIRIAANFFCISVTDNGIGFEEKYVDRIFQVFQRLHGKSQYAGTGIGLAICEKVAANHGGAITARSKPGKGATFSVYFPQ